MAPVRGQPIVLPQHQNYGYTKTETALIHEGRGFKATDLGNISTIPEVLHTKVPQLTDPA